MKNKNKNISKKYEEISTHLLEQKVNNLYKNRFKHDIHFEDMLFNQTIYNYSV